MPPVPPPEVPLDEADLAADAIDQFRAWHAEWIATGPTEPYAVVLSTAGPDGAPRGRNVLLRDVDAGGFVFFTNYRSIKGRHLAANPLAALTFTWMGPTMRRQVIVAGAAQPIAATESDDYWATRPRGSQLSAAASPQSDVLADRAELERRVVELDARYPGAVPRPEHWGGYRLRPGSVEFWQGRDNRLHDRIVYERAGPGWKITRLAP